MVLRPLAGRPWLKIPPSPRQHRKRCAPRPASRAAKSLKSRRCDPVDGKRHRATAARHAEREGEAADAVRTAWGAWAAPWRPGARPTMLSAGHVGQVFPDERAQPARARGAAAAPPIEQRQEPGEIDGRRLLRAVECSGRDGASSIDNRLPIRARACRRSRAGPAAVGGARRRLRCCPPTLPAPVSPAVDTRSGHWAAGCACPHGGRRPPASRSRRSRLAS